MDKFFPPVSELYTMLPEEIGKLFLLYIKQNQTDGRNKVHLSHYANPSASHFQAYAGNNNEALHLLAEAWSWLKTEGYLADDPQDSSNGWCFITRKGMSINSIDDFKTFSHIRLLPKDSLSPILQKHVYGLFMRGEFEKAVFEAYKAVEVKMRECAGWADTEIGVSLARKAFNPTSGVLTDQSISDTGEKQAYSDLFAGALGIFKNPSSHRYVDYTDPVTVTGLILFANSLIQIIELRRPIVEKKLDKPIRKDVF